MVKAARKQPTCQSIVYPLVKTYIHLRDCACVRVHRRATSARKLLGFASSTSNSQHQHQRQAKEANVSQTEPDGKPTKQATKQLPSQGNYAHERTNTVACTHKLAEFALSFFAWKLKHQLIVPRCCRHFYAWLLLLLLLLLLCFGFRCFKCTR